MLCLLGVQGITGCIFLAIFLAAAYTQKIIKPQPRIYRGGLALLRGLGGGASVCRLRSWSMLESKARKPGLWRLRSYPVLKVESAGFGLQGFPAGVRLSCGSKECGLCTATRSQLQLSWRLREFVFTDLQNQGTSHLVLSDVPQPQHARCGMLERSKFELLKMRRFASMSGRVRHLKVATSRSNAA